jgi:oligopeptide/dipeptide ABC transporter ATP-binding protein
VNLLSDLQSEFGTAMLFISHNLAVVRYLSRRIMVIYLGRCIEIAARDEFFARPLHPYSRALLAAASGAPGATSRQTSAVTGCAYRSRCSYAIALCEAVDPPLSEIIPGRWAACHRASEFCDSGLVA